MKSYPAILVLI